MSKKNIEELNPEELDGLKGGATERVSQTGQKEGVVFSRESQKPAKGIVVSSETENPYFKSVNDKQR